MKVYAPGKLILSGEHAILHGQPALAMAVNRYVAATITRERLPQILFDLSDLAHHSCLSIDSLRQLKNKIKHKYHRFVRGEYSIRQVLQKPFLLAQVAIGLCAESLNMSLPHGVKIQVKSDIPIGCGMGSSAATIVCVIQAISQYLQIPLTQETLFKLALETENLQHGYSSGLDLRLALQGGCLYMHGTEIQTRPLPSFSLALINTGTPLTTTGECVEKAAPYFQSGSIADEFSRVTMAMDAALREQDWQGMQKAIRTNNQLLVKIGVVPLKVQQFIQAIEMLGGAAKICGAGAVAGDNAGIVLAVIEKKEGLLSLCERFGYQLLSARGESRGVHAI